MLKEFHIDLGPLQILKIGRVWSIDLFRLRLFGVGRLWQFTILPRLP